MAKKRSVRRPTRRSRASVAAPVDHFERMKRFIRSRCDDYLQDQNINSIGIGYKVKGGARTGALAIQFCVDLKVGLETLEAVSATPVPEEIVFEGVPLPTDVVQRSFRPAYVIVEPQAILKDPRKQRADTLVPGISIGHVKTTAGTLGAIVRDQRTGERVVLSNWHVLHTPDGAIGDAIVQPGPFDDNRVTQNVVGHLVRSHLGVAGDCAISSIDARNASPDILGLKTTVGRIAQAQLGDRVVKSGRTTGVTFGVVTRVETVTRMNYGSGHIENIGGFEIGVDPKHKPKDGEISKGGDSGSCWMVTDNGKDATDVMLGLHFAGDAENSDAEFALACAAHAVFEKLEIEPLAAGPATEKAGAAVRSDLRSGFSQDFVRFAVPAPAFTGGLAADLARLDGDREIKYCHFSVWLSRTRKFPRVVAWNIDGGKIRKVSRTGVPFVKDDRGDLEKFQIGDELYANNPIDRGHLARRADLCWGPTTEAEQANRDSFFFSNITPQHERFNQGMRGGLWGRLEDAIFEDVKVADLRISLMGGPLLRTTDPRFQGIRIPTEFWKVVFYTDDADHEDKARAFILSQRNMLTDLVDPESLELDEFRMFQVPLSRIEKEAGIQFSPKLKALDTMAASPQSLGGGGRLILTQEDLFAKG